MGNIYKGYASTVLWFLMVMCCVLLSPTTAHTRTEDPVQFRRLPIETYRQRMKAGWLGQMIGVAFSAPTEFHYLSSIMPAGDVPQLHTGLINEAVNEDNLYVEMTFLKTLETYGMDASSAQAGIDFANSEYTLWHANLAARTNLRAGIAPTDSGHPAFNGFTDDIDYQIEADFAGLISPGMPDQSVRLGDTFGRIMNYGDGLYGGQFVSCMYSESFFENDPRKLVEAGLACIPVGSQYAETIRDVMQWSAENPDDWEKTWALIDEKYHLNPAYRRFSSKDDNVTDAKFDIDAKLNGAYIVLGLLYGQRDPLKTITIAMRSGQDSDCNPSNAAGILFAMLGNDQMSSEFTAGLDEHRKFSFTEYDFPSLIAVSEKLARQAVIREGGSIETDANGKEVFVIPVHPAQMSEFVQSWAAGPIANTNYGDAQMAKIRFLTGSLKRDVQRFAPDWDVVGCLDNPHLGLKAELLGRKNVLFTLPSSRTVPCRLINTINLPNDVPKVLHLVVSNFPGGDWILVVKANGQKLLEQIVSDKTTTDGWLQVDVDLSIYAGQPTRLEVLNQAYGRSWEGGYWAMVEVVDKPT
ncbi:MAG: ADP-ribosylglycohydrolase family protein [Chloroflexota bacterium]